jgi:hypothetical protein
MYAAGIGSGHRGVCGNVTITDTLTELLSIKGGNSNSDQSIGAGRNGTCGTVTVMGSEGQISQSPYSYNTEVKALTLRNNYGEAETKFTLIYKEGMTWGDVMVFPLNTDILEINDGIICCRGYIVKDITDNTTLTTETVVNSEHQYQYKYNW